jgi:hypothetical protein
MYWAERATELWLALTEIPLRKLLSVMFIWRMLLGEWFERLSMTMSLGDFELNRSALDCHVMCCLSEASYQSCKPEPKLCFMILALETGNWGHKLFDQHSMEPSPVCQNLRDHRQETWTSHSVQYNFELHDISMIMISGHIDTSRTAVDGFFQPWKFWSTSSGISWRKGQGE